MTVRATLISLVALTAVSSAVVAQSTSTIRYRLAGMNSTSNYGRLEVLSGGNNTWDTVCSTRFNRNDALVACRSLGLNTTRVWWSSAMPAMRGSSSQPIWNWYRRCSGAEAALHECFNNTDLQYYCTHNDDIVLKCRDPNEVFEYRLAGENATATSGRLEVRNGTANGTFGEWGTVCNDFFGYREAAVACKALGLNTSHPYYSTVTAGFRGSPSQPTLLDDVRCNSDDPTLDACSFTPWEADNCTFADAVHLTCSTDSATWEYRLAGTGSTARYGRLEARPNSHVGWGTVCGSNFDTVDAAVACGSFGLSYSVAKASPANASLQGYAEQPFALGSLNCNGNETSLDECPALWRYDCSHSEDIVLTCRDPNEVWEYRLAGGNATATSGRLETRAYTNSNWTDWGTVCNSNTTLFKGEAAVACRSLGLGTKHPSYWTAPTWMRGSSTQPIHMDDARCSGSETSLDHCSYYDAASPENDCGHDSDLAVSCPSASDDWEYRLAGTNATTYGRLEARTNPQMPWGTVCSVNFDTNDARVACRALGLNESRATIRSWQASLSLQGSLTQPIVMGYLNCTGNEPSPEHCGVTSGGVDFDHCAEHINDVILLCPDALEMWEYRLAGEDATPTSGRLEAREVNGATWGTVCDDAFGTADARVACRSLGLDDGFASFATATPSQRGSLSQPIVMGSVRCRGNETSLERCDYISRGHNCRHNDDVVLHCPSESTGPTPLQADVSSASSLSVGLAVITALILS